MLYGILEGVYCDYNGQLGTDCPQTYYVDVFECDGDTSIIERHIDIEYSFGEYYEVPEGSELFQFICSLYGLPLLQEEKEITIYQKDEE